MMESTVRRLARFKDQLFRAECDGALERADAVRQHGALLIEAMLGRDLGDLPDAAMAEVDAWIDRQATPAGRHLRVLRAYAEDMLGTERGGLQTARLYAALRALTDGLPLSAQGGEAYPQEDAVPVTRDVVRTEQPLEPLAEEPAPVSGLFVAALHRRLLLRFVLPPGADGVLAGPISGPEEAQLYSNGAEAREGLVWTPISVNDGGTGATIPWSAGAWVAVCAAYPQGRYSRPVYCSVGGGLGFSLGASMAGRFVPIRLVPGRLLRRMPLILRIQGPAGLTLPRVSVSLARELPPREGHGEIFAVENRRLTGGRTDILLPPLGTPYRAYLGAFIRFSGCRSLCHVFVANGKEGGVL